MQLFLARRLGVLAATAALGAGALAVVTAAPVQAAEPENARTRAGMNWLVGQLEPNRLMTSEYYDDPAWGGDGTWKSNVDLGLSIDVALALDAVDRRDRVVTDMADAAAPVIENLYTFGPTVYTGSIAKGMVLAQLAGRSVNDFGGVNLEAELEERVADGGPIAGRIENDGEATDTANTIGQSFAARALHVSGSEEREEALAFLLQQQCTAGFFRYQPAADKTAADQSCDASAASVGDVDTTASAVINLLPLQGQPGVRTAIDRAVAWLGTAQQPDGSFVNNFGAVNANSTGLAGWALGAAGDRPTARRAAEWLLRHQAVSLSCLTSPLEADQGAVAVDTNAHTFGVRDGITRGDRYTWRRATAQAVPALQYLDLDDATLTGPAGYQQDGASVVLSAHGLLPGEQACVAGQLVTGPGRKDVTVTLPATTGTQKYILERLGTEPSVGVTTLAAQTFKVRVKKKIRKGTKVLVAVAGMAPGEKVTVRLGRKVLRSSSATATGLFLERVKVKSKPGKAKLTVSGQFADRKGSKRVTVVR